MPPSLDDPIQYLKGVGPARAKDFEALEIRTVRDLLWTFPRDLADRTLLHTIADCPTGVAASVIARAVRIREKRLPGRRRLTVADFTDDTAFLEAVWFNQPWAAEHFREGRFILHAKTERTADGRLKMVHPQTEPLPEGGVGDSLHFGRLAPIYPCTGGLNQTVWRKAIQNALDSRLGDLEEFLPPEMRKGFPGLAEAVRNMHFPPDAEAHKAARARLAHDECLLLQICLRSARAHALHDRPGRQFRISPELDRRIRLLFPFRLTAAQDRSVREIVQDMTSPLPMHRLLQGDVGSGKTAVATYALLAAVANQAQACIMAPTSLLAEQHYDTINRFLANSQQARVHIALLVGGMKAAERQSVVAGVEAGAVDLLCTTHAALQDTVRFRDLGLVVVDEQHKFGVRQRAGLVDKGVRPDTLVMTATPIPRSLALTVYGDLDVSTINELPPGRKPVETKIVARPQSPAAWRAVRDELRAGRQAFVVCPLVEESEESDLASATAQFESLRDGELSGYRIELLHGRMKRAEQQAVMDRFRNREVDALVSTIVIEVGVDIPNASVMAVLNAERFGLAQLHQLRGRVGRGGERGLFFLFSDAKGEDALQRLGALKETSDGFRIAEADLRIRGAGEFLGTRQHGALGLKLVDLTADMDIIESSRAEAARLLGEDPAFQRPDLRALQRELVRRHGEHWDRAAMG